MNDIELIEKYLRGELTNEEIVSFEERLKYDIVLKEQFEIESVILKGLRFSLEKERIKQFQIAVQHVPSPLVWYNANALLMMGGLAVAAWILSGLSSNLLQLDPKWYKWIGLIFAVTLSFLGISFTNRKLDLRLTAIALTNGIVIFITSSGIDSINQGVKISSDQLKATLIPFTQNTIWWPTQSLVDSIQEQNRINRQVSLENSSLFVALQSVRDSCFKSNFDQIVPIVVNKSNIVASGNLYEGRIFMAASSSRQKLEIFGNGKKLDVQMDSTYGVMMGKVSFPVSANNYDANGQSKQTFEAELRLGDDEAQVYKQTMDYIVVKPIIKVSTSNAPTLYMNCGNNISFEVPALGTNYNPTFSGKGADILKGENIGKVTIIPKERSVFVTVINNGATLGTEFFNVKPVPKPRYVPRDNSGKEIDQKNGVKGSSLTGLRVSADADENFKIEVPNDATYRIKSMEVILARGTARVATINATSELPDISLWRSLFKPGDRIVIDIKSVTRRTFQGQEEKVDVVGGVFTIPIQ